MAQSDLPDLRDDPTDEQIFHLLEEYQQLAANGDAEQLAEWRRAHPELVKLATCLDALSALAPVESNDPTTSATILGGSEDLCRDATLLPMDRHFGKYELLEELGRGGMGVVYRAWQTDLGRTVALKMILASQYASADELRRFCQEAKAAGGLRHPNIVGVHEVGQQHGQYYFTMDYIAGPTLANRLANGPLPPEDAAACLAAVARAVHYLHTHQIVHRDLKPSNILLEDNGTPFVTDFGLAKLFEEDCQHTRTGTIVGTPSYMAPEQAAGRAGAACPRSDVYSLGAILYETLTGRPPFREANPLDTLVQVLEGEPSLPRHLNPSVPPELEIICLRCLEKNPDHRYATAAALADDLERYLRREPIDARPRGLVPRLRRWVRREPVLVSHLLGLAAAAGIVQAKYALDGTDLAYHVQIMTLCGVWAAVSCVLQRLPHLPHWKDAARVGWILADLVLLTMLLSISHPPLGVLLIGYPLLVASSGLFFQVRYVWIATVASELAYAALVLLRPDHFRVLDAATRHPVSMPQYPLIFAVILAVVGLVVALQVHRIRVLSRYYESRRLP